jgi:hypothetical protein
MGHPRGKTSFVVYQLYIVVIVLRSRLIFSANKVVAMRLGLHMPATTLLLAVTPVMP